MGGEGATGKGELCWHFAPPILYPLWCYLPGAPTHACSVTPPGTCRAHLSGPPSPGRGGCGYSGAAEEGADRETGMKLSSCSALLVSVPYPILKCSSGGGAASSWAVLDFIPVPCQGYDPDAKAAFQPKAKQKGRSSTASLVKRKKKVMDQEHRVHKRGYGQVSACPSSASPCSLCLVLPTSFSLGQSPAEP